MSLADKLSRNAASSPEPITRGTGSLWDLHHKHLPALRAKLLGNSPLMALILIKHPEQRSELKQRVQTLWQQQHEHALASIELDWITHEIFGLGPLQPLLENENLSEVMVNSCDTVYTESHGKLELSTVHFHDENHLLSMIEKIGRFVGRQVNHKYPMMDARLPDGSRVNAVIPPLALHGSSLTIRRFRKKPFTLENLIELAVISPGQRAFLELCVQGHLNIIISGGTGSGKTTLLNALSYCIPDDQRIVTIEDAAELQINKRHVIALESRPASLDGDPPVGIRDLVINALRMRPDRIIVGEIRGAEALDMLQAMNTGHDGSLTTGHANSPRDMLARIETMVLFAGYELPLSAIRRQIGSALDLIIQVTRKRDGRRVIDCIMEVVGMEGDTITTAELFRWQGDKLCSTNIRPSFAKRLEDQGLSLRPEMFG